MPAIATPTNTAIARQPVHLYGSLVITGEGKRHEWTLDQIIRMWLGEASRSESARTRKDYATILASARTVLIAAGLDLDLDAHDTPTLRALLQGWAAQPRAKDGAPVSANTYNLRLAVVSSFYTFARMNDYLACANPIERIKRKSAQDYASAIPLAASVVGERLAAINRTTLEGQRDYALLTVMLSTGRRLAEIAALRWGDVARQGEAITLTFNRAKGAKVMRDTLPTPVGAAVLAWLASYYPSLDTLAPDAPVWIALARGSRRGGPIAGEPLQARSIANIALKRLGTSKAHALRHTFAHEMEAAGAPVSEIQRRLGHSSLATTTRYLAALRSAVNPFADALAARLGIV